VIIGGLTRSLFLTLFLVPVVYIFIMSFVEARRNASGVARRLRRDPEDDSEDGGRQFPPVEQPQPRSARKHRHSVQRAYHPRARCSALSRARPTR